MKKVLFALFVVVIAASMALAQTGASSEPFTGGNPTLTNDIFGAHENGGRGCAGCHAPHSGGRGSGWQGSGTSNLGDIALWGTDTSLIQAVSGGTITFDGTYSVNLATASWAGTGPAKSIFTGVVTCLSCHDGNISKGAMMSGVSYEQSYGMLNFATTAGSNGKANSVNLYGNAPIPTLLGNDGGTAGDYSNDHPVGPSANIGKVFGNAATLTGFGLVLSTSASNGLVIGNFTGQYANFVGGYGYWALKGFASNNDGVVSNFFVTCTTCHNQHDMSIVSGTAGHAPLPIANNQITSAQTYFFVNGPYNPGAHYDPQHVPSTMRFCQQCHFSMSSEAYGSGVAVGTAF
jgi:cytochrome c553